METLATEKRAANLLLKKGVKVSITAPLFLRLLGKKNIELVITAPTIHTLLLISDKFLSMRINTKNEFTITEAFAIYKFYGKTMAEIVAIAILNSPKKMWRMKFLAKHLIKTLKPKELNYLFTLIIANGGIEDFINTIRLTETMRITKPMNLSPEEKMS